MRVLKKGFVGDDVKAVQGLLAAKGFFQGKILGNFGTLTDAAVRAFQKSEGLTDDGVVGRLTYAALTAGGPTETTPDPIQSRGKEAVRARLQAELIKLWRADVGEREEWGNNRGKMEDEINKVIGSGEKSGAPYCIAGLLVRGVKPLCVKFALKNPVYMTSGTQAFWAHAPKEFRREKGVKAKAADVGCLRNKADHSHGHCYGLTSDEVGSSQATVEYNTNVAGSRDGDGTYESKRTQSGTASKDYLGSVDVVAWIMSANPTVTELA